MDKQLIVYQIAPGFIQHSRSGWIKKSGKYYYCTIEACVEKFKVSLEIVKAVLSPHSSEKWVLHLLENGEMIPYYQTSEARTLLYKHGIKTVKNYKRKRKSRWEFSSTNSVKPVNGVELTAVFDDTFFARQEFWANLVGLNRGSLSIFLDEIEKDDRYKKHIKVFKPLSDSVLGERKIRTQSARFFDAIVGQAIIDRSDKLHIDAECENLPLEVNPNEYKTSFQWKNELYDSSSRKESLAVGLHFFSLIKEKQAFICNMHNVQFRVYSRIDAKDSLDKAMQKVTTRL